MCKKTNITLKLFSAGFLFKFAYLHIFNYKGKTSFTGTLSLAAKIVKSLKSFEKKLVGKYLCIEGLGLANTFTSGAILALNFLRLILLLFLW